MTFSFGLGPACFVGLKVTLTEAGLDAAAAPPHTDVIGFRLLSVGTVRRAPGNGGLLAHP